MVKCVKYFWVELFPDTFINDALVKKKIHFCRHYLKCKCILTLIRVIFFCSQFTVKGIQLTEIFSIMAVTYIFKLTSNIIVSV